MLNLIFTLLFSLTATVSEARVKCYDTKVMTTMKEGLHVFLSQLRCDIGTKDRLDIDDLVLANEHVILDSADIVNYAYQHKKSLYLDTTKTIDVSKGTLVIRAKHLFDYSGEDRLSIKEQSLKVQGTGEAKHVKYTGSDYSLETAGVEGYWFAYFIEIHLKKPPFVPGNIFNKIVKENLIKDTIKETAKHIELIESML